MLATIATQAWVSKFRTVEAACLLNVPIPLRSRRDKLLNIISQPTWSCCFVGVGLK